MCVIQFHMKARQILASALCHTHLSPSPAVAGVLVHTTRELLAEAMMSKDVEDEPPVTLKLMDGLRVSPAAHSVGVAAGTT